jgi:hypothetical protein
LAKSGNYKAAHCAVFCSLLLFYVSSFQIFFSASYSQIPSIYVPSLISEIKFHLYRNTGKIVYSICYIFGQMRRIRVLSGLNGSKHYPDSFSS